MCNCSKYSIFNEYSLYCFSFKELCSCSSMNDFMHKCLSHVSLAFTGARREHWILWAWAVCLLVWILSSSARAINSLPTLINIQNTFTYNFSIAFLSVAFWSVWVIYFYAVSWGSSLSLQINNNMCPLFLSPPPFSFTFFVSISSGENLICVCHGVFCAPWDPFQSPYCWRQHALQK